MLNECITDILMILKPAMVAGPVLVVVAASATYLLVKSNINGMSFFFGGGSFFAKKLYNHREEGTITLGVRRAVNEFMHN